MAETRIVRLTARLWGAARPKYVGGCTPESANRRPWERTERKQERPRERSENRRASGTVSAKIPVLGSDAGRRDALGMKVAEMASLVALAATVAGRGELSALQAAASPESAIEARIWLDRGADAVLQPGDEARVYYRASVDAYMLLFHIDTDGVLRLLRPGAPDEALRARGGRDYRLLFPNSDHWVVDEDPGVGYFFVLASDSPFEFDRLNEETVAGGWTSAPGSNRIRQDPYVTVNDFKQALLPGAEEGAYAVDFAVYYVGQAYSYPRFLCYQCHTEYPFADWNPYQQTCPDVRVVIYNDPYYYPATRYQAGRIVYPRPPEPGLPQFVFAERHPGELGMPIVRSRANIRSVHPAEPLTAGVVPPLSDPELLRRVDQGGFPILQRRSGDAGPGR